MMVTIIGRGHSGTRAISHTLSASGFYMGASLNPSGDLVPPENMYAACRVLARYVRHLGDAQWDFSALHDMEIPQAFRRLIEAYLASVLQHNGPNKGWKIPETTLVYPWIARMFPDIHYIYWIRDPRDSILGRHVTDDLGDFGVPYEPTDHIPLRRAVSWKYQADIVRSTPRPKRLIEVRFEDFVLDQENTLKRIEAFLGVPLARIPVRPESVGRWKSAPAEEYTFPLFDEELVRYNYEKA